MKGYTALTILFIINPGAGQPTTELKAVITSYFKDKNIKIELFELPQDFSIAIIKEKIAQTKADRVVAVGGDGTLKLVATCLIHSGVPIGIIAAGSANGMAKELGIPANIEEALNLIIKGAPKQIHAIQINDQICIHLSDLGFNAYLVKKFDQLPDRGMWAYAKATCKALFSHTKMNVLLKLNGKTVKSAAAMVALANATQYGTGLKINPNGNLKDELFEVILVKDYSYLEILKLWFTRLPINPKKIEVFQTDHVKISSKRAVHFQVDGEYFGKVNEINGKILPAAVTLIY